MRAVELFDFEYTLEMYKPKDKRRWGYFALPVLHHDRLVGKVDAIADRKASVLQVNAVHQDVRFTRAMTAAVTPNSPPSPAGWAASSPGPAEPHRRPHHTQVERPPLASGLAERLANR